MALQECFAIKQVVEGKKYQEQYRDQCHTSELHEEIVRGTVFFHGNLKFHDRLAEAERNIETLKYRDCTERGN